MIKFNLRGNTSSGGKALIRLGILATIIAIITTGISLYFYHASGDIYIDRSRPGFLPEKHENSQMDENLTYRFSEDGSISAKDLEEYLQNIKPVINNINDVKKPFAKDSLSDQSLGIAK